MEEFPNQNPNPEHINNEGEESQAPKSFTEHMAEMTAREKTFDELRRDGEVPEGVRDERDYQEFLAEQNARQNELFLNMKERLDEKSEILGSFEKRVECNSGFYDDLAEEVAFLWNLFPEIKYYAYGGHGVIGGFTPKIRDEYGRFYLVDKHAPKEFSKEESAKYHFELNMAYAFRDAREMMRDLRKGVESENPEPDFILDQDTLSRPYDTDDIRRKVKEEYPEFSETTKFTFPGSENRLMSLSDLDDMDNLYSKTENLIVPTESQEYFGNCLSGYFKSTKDYRRHIEDYFTQEQIEEARQKAHEMMDGDEWHEKLDEFLDVSRITSIDEIEQGEEILRKLHFSIGDDMFNYRDNGWSISSIRPDYIPDMKAIYTIWSKINEVQDKITGGYRYLAERSAQGNMTSNRMRMLLADQE